MPQRSLLAPSPRIVLRGTARLDAHVSRGDDGDLVMSGRVVDDAARPLSGAKVDVTFSLSSRGPSPAILLSSRGPSPATEGALAGEGSHAVVVADDQGRFSVRLPDATVRYVAHLASRASGLIDASRMDLAIDPAVVGGPLPPDPSLAPAVRSPWGSAGLFALGIGVVLLLGAARLSPPRREARERGSRNATRVPPSAEARVTIVRAAAGPAAAARGWTGRVRDAHDGTMVPGVRVAIERRGFKHVETVCETRSDDAGAFFLPAAEMRTGDELVAEGPLHAGLRGPVPPAGELDVALVLRKRALLDRLVDWARRRGLPFDAHPEATPGHVRRAASARSPVPLFSRGPDPAIEAIARWAGAVEQAAFGGQTVDARAQAEVDRLAPEGTPQDAAGPADVDANRRRSL